MNTQISTYAGNKTVQYLKIFQFTWKQDKLDTTKAFQSLW